MFNFDTPPPALTIHQLKLFDSLGIFPQRIDTLNIRKGFYTPVLSNQKRLELNKILQKYSK